MNGMLWAAQAQASLCEACYDGGDAVGRLASDLGAVYLYEQVAYGSVAVLSVRNRVFIAVNGTDDIHDWVQNLSARQVFHRGYLAHAGFSQTANILYQRLHQSGAIGMLAGRELILGGHSCGGSIALLLSTMPGMKPAAVVTFGSPRVFAPAAATVFGMQQCHNYRVAFADDVVPTFPLRNFRLMYEGAQYSHCGMELILSDDGSIVGGQDQRWWDRHGRSLWVRWLALWSVVSLGRGISGIAKRHSMKRYAKAVAEAVKNDGTRI